MPTKMKINKATQNVLIVVGGLIFITILYEYGTRQYYYWIQGKDKIGYDVLNAAINITLGILHIVTIGFLVLNYWIQRREIAKRDGEVLDNRSDVEYNKSIDIIFRQLELGKDRLTERSIQHPNSTLNYRLSFKQMFTDVCDGINNRDSTNDWSLNFGGNGYLIFAVRILRFLNAEFRVYRPQIDKREFTLETRIELTEIIASNLGVRVRENIDRLQVVYRDFKASDSFHPMYNRYSAEYNDIEFELNILLENLYLAPVLDLSGGDTQPPANMG